MGKYIVESKKPDYRIFAWLSTFFMIFNVFHARGFAMIVGYDNFAVNISFLTISIICLFVYAYFENKLNLAKTSFSLLDYLVIAAFLVVLATSAGSISENSSYIIRFASLIIMVFFMKNDEELVKIVFKTLVVAMIIHLIATLWFYFDKDFYVQYVLPTFSARQRNVLYWHAIHNNFATGFAGHFSLNGIYMAITSVCAFTLLFTKNHKFTKVLFFLISVIALSMTGKRGVLIFAIFAFLVTYLICNREGVFYKLGMIVPICLGLIMLVYIMSFYIDSIGATVARFLEENSDDVSNGRFELYEKAWLMFLDNPILGIGWRQYAEKVAYLYYDNGKYLDAHNVYLQLLTETGVVGFVTFIFLFVYALIRTIDLILKAIKNTGILPEGVNLLLVFSICYQVFFFGYCMTGNPLYDLSTMYVYFFCVGFTSFVDANYKEKFETAIEKIERVSKYIRRP